VRAKSRPSRRWGSPRKASRGGQVLIITLICITLLVGLIFYVYNLGTEVDRRVSLQHASDSAAISGATWMARSMNTVAMDNCQTSRLLAMVPIFDSLPLATSFAHSEMAPWEARLSDQINRSVPETPANYSLLLSGLVALRDRLASQRDILAAMDTAFNGSGFDMRTTTWWQVPGASGPPPQGALWQAMSALDSYSRASCQSAGLFAQSDAVEWGRLNRASVSFLVPVLPVLPAVRTRFGDFQPTLEGQETVRGSSVSLAATGGQGGAIPDAEYSHRLGPWARLWKWRRYFSKATSWDWVPGQQGGPGPTRGSSGNVSLAGRRTGGSARVGGAGGAAGTWQATGWEMDGYATQGPYSWALQLIRWRVLGSNQAPGDLRDSSFYDYLQKLSRIKLTYMFTSKAPQAIHEPNWIVDYDKAEQFGLTQPNQVNRTMFYLVEVASSVPESDARWLTPGTFRTNGNNPIAIWANGWINTEDKRVWPIPKIANYVWKDSYSYQTTQDPQIGILPKTDPVTKVPIWQPVYMVAWYVWGGIDVGGTVPVENPCNWTSEMDLPAPWLLDVSGGDYGGDSDQGARRKDFSFLGVARNGGGAAIWQKQFHRPLPDAVTAVAQAKLFNHTSWDLWTQDWQANLTPVSQWKDWMDQMDREADDAGNTQGMVAPQDVRDAQGYLKKLQALADGWMTH
jgi:hypothetical protein